MPGVFFLQPFNGWHFLVLAAIPAFLVVSYFIFRRKSQLAKDAYLWCLMAAVALAYAVTFGLDMARYPEYRETVLARLPLHLCSVNMFLYPLIFALRKRRKVASVGFSYMYFIGSPGALLGSLMPPADCQGGMNYNLFVYFFKHNLIFLLPVLLILLGYYRPVWKDTLRAFCVLLCFVFVIHGVNVLFSRIGGYTVNYFFTRSPEGNAILELFWKLVPRELLYTLSLVVLLVPIMAVYYLPFLLADAAKIHRKRPKNRFAARKAGREKI